jgi:hypothetical protein
VGELKDNPASLAVGGFRHPGKPGDANVAVNAQLAPYRISLGHDEGVARDDESHPSFGKLRHEPDEIVGASAIGGRKAFPGRGADEAIENFQGTDLRGLEKDGFVHANLRSVHFARS